MTWLTLQQWAKLQLPALPARCVWCGTEGSPLCRWCRLIEAAWREYRP